MLQWVPFIFHQSVYICIHFAKWGENMPTKKKTTGKKKVIDLTEDKTSTFVKNSNMNVERTFQNLLRTTNIPAMIQVSKETSIARYFLNRKLYLKLFGAKNIAISDYYLKVAVAKEAARQTNETLKNNGKYVYPGFWDTEVMVQSMMHTNVVVNSNDPTVWYLTSMIVPSSTLNDGEIEELQNSGKHSLVMEFSEYNPNRLYQVIQNIMLETMRQIINEINRNYPRAYASTEKSPTVTRMAKELGEFIKDSVKDVTKEDLEQKPVEKLISGFIDKMEKSMMIYFITLLNTAGISEDLTGDLVKVMELHAVYDTDGADNLGEVTVNYLIVVPDLTADGRGIQTNFNFRISDMVDLALADDPHYDFSISATRTSQIGNNVKKTMNGLIQIATAYAIKHVDDEPVVEEKIPTEEIEKE